MKYRLHTLTALISVVLFFFSDFIFAKEEIKSYTVNDGLSQQSVTSIIQDADGMLWIGTFDGLNMFDGKSFKTFRHNYADKNSIMDNRIINLAYNNQSGLWILYANGDIGHYEGNGKFINYEIPGIKRNWNNDIKSLKICDNHIVVMNHISQLVINNPLQVTKTKRIKAINKFLENLSIRKEVALSMEVGRDFTWISTNKSIYACGNDFVFHKVSGMSHFSIKEASNGLIILWNNSQVRVCNPLYNDHGKVSLTVMEKVDYLDNVQTVESSQDGVLWIGTQNGLYRTSNGKSVQYPPYSPTRCIYTDNMGIIWCGGLNGLQSISEFAQPIWNFRFNPNMFHLENHLYELSASPFDNELWASVMYQGLYLLERVKDSDGNVKLEKKNHFFENGQITMVVPYAKDSVIVGRKNSLTLLTKKNGHYIPHDLQERDKKNGDVFRGCKDGNVLWYSNGIGLYTLTFENGNPLILEQDSINSQLPSSSLITSILALPKYHCILIGYRGNGVYLIDTQSHTVQSLESKIGVELSNNYIWDLYYDSKERLWIGTDSGLNRIIMDKNGEFCNRLLSVADGLRNDKIERIQEDIEGDIWFGTSQGIVCYNPDKDIYVTYDHEDGFQSNTFTHACTSSKDGTLYFGGINGISVFDPTHFTSIDLRPSLVVTAITSGVDEIIKSKWDKISLPHNNNNLTIELNSYYPINPGKIRYRYSVNGEDWNEISGNKIILSDLIPNKYRIRITCFAEEDKKSEIIEVNFKVRRHLLLTPFAFLLYILIAGIVVFFISRNIISRKMLDNKLKMQEQLRESENRMNNEKLNFYTNMAHEIKTPLSLILGRLYDIEHSDEASPYIIRKAKLIGDNTQIIKELTEQILDFKRAVAGKLELETQIQDIMPCIREIIDNYKDYANKRGITLELESSDSSIIKNIDQKKLVRILYNLLSNAIKFSERDDKILVKIIGKQDSLCLTVADTGSGIPEEDLPHIFERFYKSGKSGGSGIGLAFTKSLVELMGGTITVSSIYGEGTVFQINIPDHDVKPSVPTEDTVVVEHQTKNIISVHDKIIPSILLVEDNIDLNEYITEILSVKFKVHQTYNGKEAMHLLKIEHIDMVISDVMMPEISGIELAKKIKNTKSFAHIPIMFLSAKTNPEDQLEGLETGAVDYITKPFNPHILLVKTMNILSQYYLSKAMLSNTEIEVESNDSVANRDEIFINKAKEIIYKNLSDENFGVISLSQEMGISRVHLTREFDRIISQSPSSFIKSIRLNHARHLLLDGEYSIKEVLWEIGIKSHSGFTKAFKEKFGYLPSQVKEFASSSQSTTTK